MTMTWLALLATVQSAVVVLDGDNWWVTLEEAARNGTLLVVVGIGFLVVAIFGGLPKLPDPGKAGRIVAGALGAVLLVTGLILVGGNGGGPVDKELFLADHKDLFVDQSNIYDELQWRRVYWQEDVVIDNDRYDHALGMHAPDNGIGYALFKIPPGAKHFRTVFGLARYDKEPGQYGNASGSIFVDGRQVWKATVAGPHAVRSPPISVQGAHELRLEVDSQGSNWADHTTWGDPYFDFKNKS